MLANHRFYPVISPVIVKSGLPCGFEVISPASDAVGKGCVLVGVGELRVRLRLTLTLILIITIKLLGGM